MLDADERVGCLPCGRRATFLLSGIHSHVSGYQQVRWGARFVGEQNRSVGGADRKALSFFLQRFGAERRDPVGRLPPTQGYE